MRHKHFIKTVMAAICLAAGMASHTTSATAAEQGGEMAVTLLGTGTPSASPTRFGFSNLIQANGLNLVFDAGRGAVIRLAQSGVRAGQVDAVFLTHFHSDHVNGLADLWMMRYLEADRFKLKTPFQLHGPQGTAKLARGLEMAHEADVNIRVADEGIAREAGTIEAHEFDEGLVFERNGVKVHAFKVFHGEKIQPAVGYRIEYAGRSVVISGDTRYHENVLKYGTGADVLIHEVAVAPVEVSEQPRMKTILAHHTTPEEAGKLFQQAAPRLAVYSHIVRLSGGTGRGNVSFEEIAARTRTTYDGSLLIGQDLMRIRIGKGLTVLTPSND